MKYLLTILIALIAVTAQAQFNDPAAQSYANKVFENTQGYIDEYGEDEQGQYAIGYTSEYMEFSTVRLMVGLIATSYGDINVIQSWSKDDGVYSYAVIIEPDDIMLVMYNQSNKKIVVAHVKMEG